MHHMSWHSAIAVTLKFAASLVLALVIVAARSHESRADSSPFTFFSCQERSTHPYFPESQIVLDMAILSHAVYKLKNRVTSCNDARARDRTLVDNFLREEGHGRGGSRPDNFHTEQQQDLYKLLLPEGSECLYYSHDHSLGTQVLIVRSYLHRYVAVAYAGTDDWRTALMDGNIMMSDFGPANITKDGSDMGSLFDDLPDGIRVHSGFNEAVFDSEYFHEVLNCVKSARLGGNCGDDVFIDSGGLGMNSNSSLVAPYQLFTTGHSLGAADSVLLGATLHLIYPNDDLRSVNFGCPKIGNIKWAFWINSLQPDKKTGLSPAGGSFEVFRFVNKIDLVPRLPELVVSLDPLLTHTGHTLQMSAGGIVRVSRGQMFIFYFLARVELGKCYNLADLFTRVHYDIGVL
jgi:hypothetical protein